MKDHLPEAKIARAYPGFEMMPDVFAPLSPQEEQQFMGWYRDYAEKAGVSPDPNEPEHAYNYRAWWRAMQMAPEKFAMSEDMHAPSLFKRADHPNRYVMDEAGMYTDSITGNALIAR